MRSAPLDLTSVSGAAPPSGLGAADALLEHGAGGRAAFVGAVRDGQADDATRARIDLDRRARPLRFLDRLRRRLARR